ncbi:hypothetical protein P154DRAFT_449530 [Amniculicola lignicola CBS 123094]|uniref:Chromo domain-containing protein n=1 Tax=Amniculicola lignicola CBS 123094 TaxID=1392246 RepID=A0A6A5W0K9_9PLEO|nr:hypothetical protein P154DRAFT_449530 [Amniculicola lignicola CBS 123094]
MLTSDLDGGSTNEDDEYEVEKILNARVNRRKLQYCMKWLGYKDNLEWYNAANFKNCLYKLRSFYVANPLCLGPLKRLEI